MTQNDNKPQTGFGDIGMIRDILMGQQINDYEKRFQDLNEFIAKMDARIEERINTLEAQINERFNRVEQLLQENTNHLNTKIQSVSTHDKNLISDLLKDLSTKLREP